MTHSLTGEQLMQAATTGDRDAQTNVHQTYFRPVFRYLVRRAGSTHVAEDLAQQVFVRVLTTKTPYTPTGKDPLAYLFTIARNILTDHWRSEGRKAEHVEYDDTQAASLTYTPDGLDMDIASLLRNLEDTDRKILELRFFHGLSSAEVATKLDLSPASVRQKQCRALKALRTNANQLV